MRTGRTLTSAVLVGAALLSACDSSVTPPVDRQPADANALLFVGGVTWSRTDLPFSPRAINDAGVIVGTRGTAAVRWRSGVLDTLPQRVGLAGPYTPEYITPSGVILGTASGHIVYWFADHVQPVDVSDGYVHAGSMTAVAMNDSYTIVAWWRDTNERVHSVRWRNPGPWVDISASTGPYGLDGTVVNALNAAGQATGYRLINQGSDRPVRWDATSVTPIALSAPLDQYGDRSGKGISIDGAGNIFGYTAPGNTVWTPYGASTVVTLPSAALKRSNAGRYIGWGSNGGVNQTWTSFNGAVTWLSNVDGTSAIPADVNSCGTIVVTHGDNAGFQWKRTSIVAANTCDTQVGANPGMAM